MLKSTWPTVGVAAIVLLSATQLNADLMIGDHFYRNGQTESLVAPFDVFGGTTTSQLWSGLLEVEVSGYGFSTPGSLTDAFYPLDLADPSIGFEGSVQGLRLSFTGCAANLECGAPRIEDFIVFVEGEGFVTPPYGPQYSPSHVYRFVIDIGPTEHFLTFGEGDGGVYDNYGQFDITLHGLSVVPEPSSLVLCLVSLGTLGCCRRLVRRRPVRDSGH